jgi:hypothetical protein
MVERKNDFRLWRKMTLNLENKNVLIFCKAEDVSKLVLFITEKRPLLLDLML